MTFHINLPEMRELTQDELRLVDQASEQFWAVIADGMPYVHSGDYPPDALDYWLTECRKHVQYWVSLNEGSPADTTAVYEELLSQLNHAGHTALQDQVFHVFPGYIDIVISDRIVLGFDPDEPLGQKKAGWRCLIKPNAEEEEGNDPYGDLFIPVKHMSDTAEIARSIIKVAFKGVSRG